MSTKEVNKPRKLKTWMSSDELVFPKVEIKGRLIHH